jgi:crotonobetainyl-CoA:carnitine CoA-transferase CaiB-like acyl-CoA transferase
MTRPLEGLKVLDLTRLLPGGYATLLLADLGAEVLKIEEPGRGDYVRWTPPMVGPFSAAHAALNRNKRSMTLNLKTEAGRDLYLRLVEEFDVLVESFRPGVLDRLGVGYDVLRDANPRLIYCAITGYGQDGPRSQVAGHDANYIGYAGVLGITGIENDRPILPGVQIGDLGGGGMASVIAILAALQARERTGAGDFCDISMMDGAFSWLSMHAGQYAATREVPKSERMPLSGLFPCYRVYPASDGYLTVGALEPQFWKALCDTIERPDLLDDAYAVGSRRDEVIEELSQVFRRHSRAEWMERFDGVDACVGPVNDFEEAFADEQLRHRDMVVDEDLEGGGAWTHVGNPVKLRSSTDGLLRLPPPGLGEHTTETLRAIGIDEAAENELRSSGAI